MGKRLIVVFLALMLLAGCSGSYKLRYLGTPGESRKYQMDINLEQNMQMMDSEISMTIQIVNFLTQKIHAIDNDGSLEVSFIYDSLHFDATGPQLEAMKEMLQARLDSLKGIELSVKLSNQGKILESTKIDSLIPQQLQQAFNTRQLFSALSPRLPDRNIKIGDSWEVEEEVPVKLDKTTMTVSNKSKYVLVATEDVDGNQMLKISSTGTVAIEGEIEQHGMKLFLEGDGDTKGEFLFDVKKGAYHSGVGETEMDMTIAMTGPQNMTIPMTQFVKIKISSGK